MRKVEELKDVEILTSPHKCEHSDAEIKGVGAIAKPLKWHYLLTNYLKNIVEGVEPQGTIDLQNYNLMDLYE